MHVSMSAWIITIAALLALLVLDFLIVARKPHEPSLREATLWVSFYVGIALRLRRRPDVGGRRASPAGSSSPAG